MPLKNLGSLCHQNRFIDSYAVDAYLALINVHVINDEG